MNKNAIKDFFKYNPSTGEITRKTPPSKYFSCDKKRDEYFQKVSISSPFKTIATGGYLKGSFYKKDYSAHRVAWFLFYGFWPSLHIDHIDGNRKNNKISNLRQVTVSLNNKNLSISKRNKTGCVGVSWDNQNKKWRACIRIDKKTINLGRFTDIESAISARKDAEKEFGFHVNHGKLFNPI